LALGGSEPKRDMIRDRLTTWIRRDMKTADPPFAFRDMAAISGWPQPLMLGTVRTLFSPVGSAVPDTLIVEAVPYMFILYRPVSVTTRMVSR